MDSGTSLLVEESVAFPAYGDQPQREDAKHDGTSAASSSWHGGVARVWHPRNKLACRGFFAFPAYGDQPQRDGA